MIALSIRQPWAWLIVNGYKDIENRVWRARHRGPLLIHAAKGMTRIEYQVGQECAQERGVTVPPADRLARGGIVGQAVMIDCVEHSDSPWYFGDYGFLLRDAKPLPFRPYRGALGFFDVPPEAHP